MEEAKPLPKFNCEVFKEQILLLVKELKIHDCGSFKSRLSAADTVNKLREVFRHFHEEISEELGFPEAECDECEEKDDEISSLEDEIAELERKSQLPNPRENEGSLYYQMKVNAFLQNSHRFTV